jgi:hypothetical protein
VKSTESAIESVDFRHTWYLEYVSLCIGKIRLRDGSRNRGTLKHVGKSS